MTTLTPQERNAIEVEIVDALCTVYDPEIPVNIYELGLIYDIAVGKSGDVKVEMTLTSPGCPVAGTLPGEVESKIRRVDGVTDAKVELVWEPAWSMDRMSDEAKLELGML
jgi:FeS assembly SUF system protein